jgi:endonuclease YncB( thermonuclease family)
MVVTPAHADPCKAIPDKGPMPAYLHRGAAFAGPVVYVGDGDSLCVGLGPAREQWVEVRIADFYAPELHEPAGPAAQAALERVAMGKRATCQAQHRSHDRVVAVCRIGGRSVGDLMRAAGVEEGGNR